MCVIILHACAVICLLACLVIPSSLFFKGDPFICIHNLGNIKCSYQYNWVCIFECLLRKEVLPGTSPLNKYLLCCSRVRCSTVMNSRKGNVSCLAGALCQQVGGGSTEKNRELLSHWIFLQN